MPLLFELLLTAVVTLLAAFLLATFFAADVPRREPDRAAVVAEEERIIEVDEVKLSERRAGASAPEADEWVEVEKEPTVVVKDVGEEPDCSPEAEEEGVPLKAARAVHHGAGLDEEEVDVGEKRCDLTAAAASTTVVAEPNPRMLVVEDVHSVIPDVPERVQYAGATQHDLGDEAARTEVLAAQPEKQGVQVAEALPTKLEAVEAEQPPLVSEDSADEAVDDRTEENMQGIQVRLDELGPETVSEEGPDVVLEKKEEQVVALTSVPQAAIDVSLTEDAEELTVQQPVEEDAVIHEDVQSMDEAKCEAGPVNQQEELVPEEELHATKTGDVKFSHESSSSDKMVTELPAEVITSQGPPEDGAEVDIDFGDWEGIERSEVEKRFGVAAAFASSEAGVAALSKLNSDVQLQLQGLLKVSIDGPCYDSTQPLTLRPSSRAKWIAWQKLGNMHPEIAMEKYMCLLSEVIPGWLGNETADTKKHETEDYSGGTILTMAATSDQQSHRGSEDSIGIDEGHLTASPNPEKGESSNIPAE